MKRLVLSLILVSSVTAGAQLRPWNDYRTILWMSGNVDQHAEQWPIIAERMREMGINTGMGGRDAPPQKVIASGFGYYVENIINKGLCLKFSSSVTNWSKHIDEWSKTRSADAFVRDYSFDDPKWLGAMTDLMSNTAATHVAAKPLMYDLRDELSVTISANPFDYDFSPTALAGFREWLKTVYPNLAALNAQWNTEFESWDAVMPFTTDQIKARMVTGEKHPKGEPDWQALKKIKFDPAEVAKHPDRWNFSPWCDHRTYMDVSLARTLETFRKASHAKDPHTPVGIEGTQMPSAFGGYDLWRLSQVLDWAEPYDVGNAREILGSFMPGKPLLATVFEKDTNAARRRLWHLLLLGDKGCIVWWSDDMIDWSKPDLPLTAKAKALAPVLREMTSPLAKLFLLAERETDPIAIHYSQPSIQVAWLLESIADGKTWPRRFSSFEATHNKHAQVRNSWLKLLQDLGYSPGFVSGEQLQTRLKNDKPWWKCLIYPESYASSEQEGLGAAANYAVDGLSAWFDNHGRLHSSDKHLLIHNSKGVSLSALGEDSDGRGGYFAVEGSNSSESLRHFAADRLKSDALLPSQAKDVSEYLRRWSINPAIRVPPEARVRTHRYQLGQARLLAFERNIDYKMSEDLVQAGGNAELEKPITFTASWNGDKEVIDLRTGKHLGRCHQIEVALDPWLPALYALLDKVPEGDPVSALLAQADKGKTGKK